MLQTLNGFRPGTLEGRYVIVCTRPGREWRVAQLSTREGAPLDYVGGQIFGSVGAAQQAVAELQAVRRVA